MENRHLTYRFSAMGTTAEILVSGLGYRAIENAADLVHELERRWSRFLADSEIAVLNRKSYDSFRAGTDPHPVLLSDETYELLVMAIDAWQQSEGVFDPTIGGSIVSAGYDRSFELLDKPAVPKHTIRTGTGSGTGRTGGKPAPGPGQIELDDLVKTVTVPPGIILDLGGIAKGRAADLLAQHLLDIGADGCCVNIGGDLRATGRPPRAEGWQIELDCPGVERSRHVGLAAGAICTTSKSKRRWAGPGSDGGVEHHLRDPRTGASFETGVMSVTVIAARATQAEVLCKMAFAAGLDQGPALLAARGATGMMVGDDGTIVEVAGFERYRAAALDSVDAPRAMPAGVG